MMRFSRLILGLLVSPLIVAGYTLVDVVIGNDFYSFFNWQQIKDPSEARVLSLFYLFRKTYLYLRQKKIFFFSDNT